MRLDLAMAPGDVVGIGWEKRADSTPQPRGDVYFTHRGRRQAPIIEDVSGALWPVVHIQKKVRQMFVSSYLYSCVMRLHEVYYKHLHIFLCWKKDVQLMLLNTI